MQILVKQNCHALTSFLVFICHFCLPQVDPVTIYIDLNLFTVLATFNDLIRFIVLAIIKISRILINSWSVKGEAKDMSALRKAVFVVVDPASIRLLADFTRSEILRFLSKYPMTETQLSEQLGMTRAAVGYQLHLLMDAGLISVDRVEAEKHGILQKFYTPIADLFIIDPDHIPADIQRYFVRTQIEHLRGMFSVFQLYHHVMEFSSETFEKLAIAMLRQLKTVGQKHMKDMSRGDAESLKVNIYAEALANLTKEKEWRACISGSKDN